MCDLLHKASTIDEWRVVHELRKMEALIKRDKYERFAAELQELLQLSWDAVTRSAIEQVVDLLTPDMAISELDVVVGLFRDELAESYAAQIEDQVTGMISNIYSASVDDIVAGIAQANAPVLSWLQDHHMYWIGNHYDQAVQDRIVRAGTRVLEQGLGRLEAGDLFREEFQAEFAKSQAYWEGLANHVTTRSREFARLDGYLQEGTERYQISIVNDDRTSDICLALDGTIIEVSAAIEQRDRIIAASDPEEVKEIAPWRKVEEVIDNADDIPSGTGRKDFFLSGNAQVKDAAKLASLGVLSPPFHFNCRTRTLAL